MCPEAHPASLLFHIEKKQGYEAFGTSLSERIKPSMPPGINHYQALITDLLKLSRGGEVSKTVIFLQQGTEAKRLSIIICLGSQNGGLTC